MRTPPPLLAPVSVASGAVEVGPVMPLVKGLLPSVAVPAPVYAGARVEAVVSGSTEVLLGFKTLRIVSEIDTRQLHLHDLLVDDVNDAVGNKDVGDENLGLVDVDGLVDHTDGDVSAIESGQ